MMNKLLIRLMKSIFENSISKHKLIFAANPFTLLAANDVLNEENMVVILEIIKYISSLLKDGYNEAEILEQLADSGYDIGHQGFVYAVKYGLRLGLMINEQIPEGILTEMVDGTYQVVLAVFVKLASIVGNQHTIEPLPEVLPYSLPSAFDLLKPIKDFVMDHPIIVVVALGVFVGLVFLSSRSEKTTSTPPDSLGVDKLNQIPDSLGVDKLNQIPDLQEVVYAIDVLDNHAYLTYSTITGLTVMFYLVLYFYYSSSPKRRTSS